MTAPLGSILAWRAEVTSEHFHFAGIGATEEQAREELGRALYWHGEQYGLAADWSDYLADMIEAAPVMCGRFRDGEQL